MTRLLPLVALSLAMALTSAFGEVGAQRIHVTVKIVQQAFTGDLANPKLGDQLISSAELFDEHEKAVGTGAGICTIVSIPQPPEVEDTRVQCLLTAVFEFDKKGQIIFGGIAPLPEAGVVAPFGILGGTDGFRKVRGEVTLTVISPVLQDGIVDLE
jgi:hypothetical protein